MKKHYIISFLILVIGISIFLTNTNNPQEVCIENKKCFSVEIAETDEEKRVGLSEHESLAEENGMLFVFEQETRPGFWMKDMDFSLDIIWINSDLEIVGIEKNLEPCSKNNCPVIYSEENVKYVLETSAGLSDLYDFEKGDTVEIK